MRTLYMVKYGCGQWEDYHEDIVYMSESFDDAKQECLRLQSETDQRLQENQKIYNELNKLDEEDIQEIFDDVVDDTYLNVSFYEFVDSPDEYREVLDLFDNEMQKKLLRYAELHEKTNSISIFDNDFDSPHYFMTVYKWSDNGQMSYQEYLSSVVLENMECYKQN